MALLLVLPGVAAAGDLTVDPTSRAFGNVLVGTTSSSLSVIVTNTGVGSEQIDGVILSGSNPSQFSVSGCGPFPTTLAPQETCVINFQFSPVSSGVKSATATLSDSDINNDTVSLTGTGVQPVVDFDVSDLAFGDQAVGTSSAGQTVTISNQGNATLTISSIGMIGGNAGDFTTESNTCAPFPKNLSPAASCTVTVRFAPTGAGARASALRVTSNAPTGTDDLPLSGTGIVIPELTFAPTSLSFGDQTTGTSSGAQTLTIGNTGSGDLELQSIGLAGPHPGDFTIESNTCLPLPNTLAPGEECTLGVRFAPTATGTRTASVHVVSAAGQHDAALTGSATAAAAAPPPDPPPTDPGAGEPAAVTPTTTELIPVTPVIPSCRVPRLIGKTLAAARRALRRANCALGRVTRRRSSGPPGRVVRQGRRAGTGLPRGSRVMLVLSRS